LGAVGAFQVTINCVFELLPAGAVTVGAVRPAGADAPVIWLLGDEGVDVPAPFWAVTVKV
jgi:hypothetical protein